MAPGVSCRPIVLILTTFCLPVLVRVAAAAQAVPDVTFVTACEGDPGGENVTLGSTSFIFLDGDKLGDRSYCYCNFSSRDVINVSTHRARGIYAFAAEDGASVADYWNCFFANRCRWNGSNIQLQLNPCHGQGGTYILLKVQGAENSSVNVTCAANTKTVERCTAATSATASSSSSSSSSSTAPSSVPLATTALSASAGTSWTTTALSASAGTSRTTTPGSDATATNSEIVTAEQNSSRDLNATHGQDSRAASPSAVPGPSTPANTSASPGSLGAGESQTADVNRPNMTSTVVLGVGAGLIALALVIVVVVVLTNRRRRAGADPQCENEAGKQGETKQPRPGKGGRSRFRPPGPSQPDPGTAALHSSRASLISELHDYEDVSEDGLSQAQQQQQQRDAPPSRKVSKDSARLDAAPMPGRDVYSHFSPSGSANGPNYTNVSTTPASATTPTKDGDYNKLDLRPAPRQSGPSGKVAAKALTLPKTSAPADQGSRVYGQSDECARSPIAHSGEGDIYENVDDRRENSSGSRRRKPRKGEEKEKGGGAGGEMAEDMYQNCISSKGGNRSLPRLGVMSGGGDSFRLSPRLSRAGSWRLSWRRRNHGKGGQPDKALADLDVRHLPLPRDPCGTDDDGDNPYEIEDGPFGRPLPPRLPPSVSRATNLRRNSSRSMDNVSRAVLLKVARDATRRLGLNRPKSMELSQLELMPDSARSSFHSSRSQGDGAETLPRVINDLNDEDQYEEIPGLCPPIPAKFSVPGSRPLGANTTLSPPSHSLSVPAADPVPQATSSRPGPARRTSPRSRTSSEPPKASPRPERAATRPRVQAPEAGEAEVVLRRSSKAVSPTKVKVDKPPLPQDGKFSAEEKEKLKLLRLNVLELQTAVRKSMEIHQDELLMVDNVLYATLPRNSSQPTTEL